MFKISNKVRRLSDEEKLQYKNDGYITALPVFSEDAKRDLDNFFYHSKGTFLAALHSKSQDEKSVSPKLYYTREHNTRFLFPQSYRVPPPVYQVRRDQYIVFESL